MAGRHQPLSGHAGQTVITLLIYDLKTYKPVTDANAELYLAPPDSTAPCCQKGVAAGPFGLTHRSRTISWGLLDNSGVGQGGAMAGQVSCRHKKWRI